MGCKNTKEQPRVPLPSVLLKDPAIATPAKPTTVKPLTAAVAAVKDTTVKSTTPTLKLDTLKLETPTTRRESGPRESALGPAVTTRRESGPPGVNSSHSYDGLSPLPYGLSPQFPRGEEEFIAPTPTKSLSAEARNKLISNVSYGELLDDSPMPSPENHRLAPARSVTSVTILMTVDDIASLIWARDLVSQTIARFGEITPQNVIVPIDTTSESLLFLLTRCQFERQSGNMIFDFSGSRPDSLLGKIVELLTTMDRRMSELGAPPIPVCFNNLPKSAFPELSPNFECTFTGDLDEVFPDVTEYIKKKGNKGDIVAKGNWRKFSQNGRLRGILLSTGNAPLIYCVPDAVLGAASSVDEVQMHPYDISFKGQNVFGDALRIVRTTLIKKLN